ncbi:MAG: MTH1187 family thiamine-binding protein [Candidatus Bathyarchaeia archaeon]|nr:MTH1187 family thiamine-binding protein [Candidatus Bathyarchaeota archaeon]
MSEGAERGFKVIVQFSTSPVGEGVGVSGYVAEALREVKNSGLRFQLTPMSTILEAENVEDALRVVMRAHEAIFRAGAKRVVTDIKIDDRRDKPRRMEDKVEKVLRNLA